jgi:hypothetical protein
MLTGEKLGNALREAIRLKGVSNAEVARYFGVKGPSVYDWLRYGRIGKKHIDRMVSYFADVVPPEHWGIASSLGSVDAASAKSGDNDMADHFDDIRTVQTLMARALARSIPDVGVALFDALEGLPEPQRSHRYLRDVRVVLDASLPPHARRAPTRPAQGSTGRKRP